MTQCGKKPAPEDGRDCVNNKAGKKNEINKDKLKTTFFNYLSVYIYFDLAIKARVRILELRNRVVKPSYAKWRLLTRTFL